MKKILVCMLILGLVGSISINNIKGFNDTYPNPSYNVGLGYHEQTVTVNNPIVNQDYYLYDNESYWYDVAPLGSYCWIHLKVYLKRGSTNWKVYVNYIKGTPY